LINHWSANRLDAAIPFGRRYCLPHPEVNDARIILHDLIPSSRQYNCNDLLPRCDLTRSSHAQQHYLMVEICLHGRFNSGVNASKSSRLIGVSA
jgi:hypothetical protein